MTSDVTRTHNNTELQNVHTKRRQRLGPGQRQASRRNGINRTAKKNKNKERRRKNSKKKKEDEEPEEAF